MQTQLLSNEKKEKKTETKNSKCEIWSKTNNKKDTNKNKKKKSCRNFEKKKRRKEEREKRESGCLIFEHEIEAVRGFFLAENRVPNPLI